MLTLKTQHLKHQTSSRRTNLVHTSLQLVQSLLPHSLMTYKGTQVFLTCRAHSAQFPTALSIARGVAHLHMTQATDKQCLALSCSSYFPHLLNMLFRDGVMPGVITITLVEQGGAATV